MRTLIITVLACAASMNAEELRGPGKLWNRNAPQQPQTPEPSKGWPRVDAEPMANNQTRPSQGWRTVDTAQASPRERTEEVVPQPAPETVQEAPVQTDRVPMCTAGNTNDTPNPPKDKQGTIRDIATGTKYVAYAVHNPYNEPLPQVFIGRRTLVRNLCPGAVYHVYLDKSWFSTKKPHTLRLYAIDPKNIKHESPDISLDQTDDASWSVGNDDAEGPRYAWAQKITRKGMKEGFDPDIAADNIRKRQAQGMPGAIAADMEKGQIWNEQYPGSAVYGQPGYAPFPGGYQTGYGGNFHPQTVRSVELYEQGVWDPYSGMYVGGHGPGTAYRGQCGSVFAPATWPNSCGGGRGFLVGGVPYQGRGLGRGGFHFRWGIRLGGGF